MILCCGEALIDMLPRNLPSGEQVFLPVPGGAVYNTAVALGRLTAPTGFLCGISRDLFGELLLKNLADSNVDGSFCIRSGQPTTLAFVTLKDGNAEYAFFDENSALRSISVADLPAMPANVTALHFGAISLIPETSGAAFEALLTTNAQNRVISLDPNIRPGFIEDEDAYRSRLNRMMAQSDIIKVSDDDLAWLSPGIAFEAFAAARLESGTSLVVQTLGAEGAQAISKQHCVTVPGHKVDVVDTVGAGDTFNAGLLFQLYRSNKLDKSALSGLSEAELTNALEFASKVASKTVTRAGADSPRLSELEG